MSCGCRFSGEQDGHRILILLWRFLIATVISGKSGESGKSVIANPPGMMYNNPYRLLADTRIQLKHLISNVFIAWMPLASRSA